MKADETQNGATSFLQTNSISFQSSNHMKYNGLIEQSFYKKVYDDLAQLFNYVYADAPAFTIVHNIVTIIRLLQIGGPSLCAGYYSLWSTKDSARSTIAIISIFFHLIPPSSRDIASVYFLIIYIVILLALLTLLFASAFVYRKSANLPSVIPTIISFYFAFFGPILHPIAFELAFSELGRAIFETSHYTVPPLVILFIISFAISLLYFWIFLMIAQMSIMFRPNSIQTVCFQPQTITFVLQLVITVFTGFPETLSNKHTFQGVMILLAAFAYFVSIYNAFYYGGIISPVMTAAFLSTCITSGVMCIINAVLLFMKKEATLIFLIIYILMYIIFFVLSMIFWNKKRARNLRILDGILDDVSRFEDIKSVNNYVNIAVDGFYVAHPICISFQFLKMGIEKWPEDQMTWFIYAKFVSVYPEETQTLAWIFRMIVTKKVKGSAAKTVKEQSLSVARQREPNLSADLKSKLNSVSKHITSTKHKLRRVWDLAIQGNIHDMEAATKRAITEIEKSDAELLHVIHQFPNNRFVTRQYARFCSELKADKQAYMEMIENTRLLQRGVAVNKDQAHEFGLAVFHQLPDKIGMSKDQSTLQGQATESMTTSQMEIETEDDNQGADDSLLLVQRIESLVIPSTRYSIVYRLIMVLILFVAPAIFVFIYTPMYESSLIEPLEHIQHITMIRTFLFQILAFSEQRVYEVRGYFKPANETRTTDKDPSTFGGSWDTRESLITIANLVSETMQRVEEFRTFDDESKYITKAKSNLFDSILDYSYFVGSDNFTQKITVQNGLADFVLQQKSLISETDELPADVVNSSVMLNLIINAPQMGSLIDDTLSCLTIYLQEKDNSHQKLFKILMISIICVSVFVFTIGLVVQLLWINSNKEQVYKCLTALPKNAVSALTENLRVLKKEAESSSTANANTEMNKQEDNIMKIFVVGGSSSSTKMLDAILLITSSLIMIAMHIGCTVVFLTLLQNQSKYIRQNSPHLNYLQGAYSLAIAAEATIILLIVNDEPDQKVGLMTKEYLLNQYNERIVEALDYYHKARFGSESIEDPPYSGFLDGVTYAQSQIECKDKYDTPDLLTISQCYSPDLLYILIKSVWDSKIIPLKLTDKLGLDNEDVYSIIWSFLVFPIYYALFYPMAMSIVDNIENNIIDQKNSVLPFFIVMFVIAIIFEIIATVQALRIELHIKKVLRLLLHVPTKTVMQTPKIVRILSGDFKKQRGDSTMRDNEFYRSVVQNLPDAVLVANAEGKIETVNKSFTRILSVDESQVIDETLNEFFGDKFHGNVSSLLQVANGGKSKTENLVYKKDTETNLEATSYLINQRVVILFRDVTQTVRYNTLIKEEKSKSDVLLSSILPPSLVKRVQAGEQNISFAVQTATIVFMDIVSFTPWCGSLPADKVMSTLNNLFRRFDAALAREPEMTKIKCIGDCYMAAGGVFAEVNQPAEHAKEVVLFGLDALDCVTQLNEELGEKLQIRVGINTGGPIVAGVLGIGKPTFEIIGPAINMAQQMEHHGVPMQVHVSRSVYELIYGDTFIIKERGVVEVKGGSVVTYLVTRTK